MKENELSLKEDIESLKMSNILEIDKKTDNKEEKIDSISSSNLFNNNDKASSEEEEDSSLFESFDSITDAKNLKIKRKIKIYNIKDHLLMIFLLISSSMNFSILYIPLFIIGIIYIYLLFNNNNNNKKTKLKIEISCLIYSVILIIFKLTLIGIIDNGNLEDKKNTLNNLGIRYDVDDKRVFDVVITFIGEGCLLLVSIFSVIISILYKKVDMENQYIPIPKEKIFLKIRVLMIFCYILLILFGAYNVSFLTLVYILIYNFLLIVTTKNIFLINLCVFKKIRYFFLCILPIHLLLINIFNIYSIQKEVLKKNIIPKGAKDSDIDKVYSFLTKIGISYSYYDSFDTFIYGCISYIFGCFIIVLLTSSKKIIKDYNILISPAYQREYELKDFNNENIYDNSEIKEEKDKIGFMAKINKNIIYFLTHSEFILHLIRIISVFWIYYLRNLFSIGVFLSLFFSFILNDIKKIKNIIVFLLIPVINVSLLFFHISNINGYFEDLDDDDKDEEEEKYRHYGLEKNENKLKYFLIGIYYLFIILFLNSFNNISNENMNINFLNNKILLSESEGGDELSNDKIKPLLIKKNKSKKIENNKKENKSENENKGENEDENEDEKEIENEIENKDLKNKVKEENNQNEENVKLIDVILKFSYENIDKITLVVMYFISMIRINIIHFIFILIFMIQILQPQIIKTYHTLIIIIIQLLFLFEYIVDITKNHYYDTFERKINLFGFLLTLDNDDKNENQNNTNNNKEEINININIEIFCYLAIYAFYIQNRLIHSTKYQELEKNEKISFENYINFKFKKHKTIKKVLFIIFDIMIEIYIWSMFLSFFCVCCLFEINLLFSIKLGLFFYVIYNYLQKSQIIQKNIEISLKMNFFLIAYCCFNSFIVYGYQLLCLDLMHFYSHVKTSSNKIVQNLPSIGLKNYENDNELLYKLLPHFLSNFLSILMYNQIKLIYARIDSKKYENNLKDGEKTKIKLLNDIIIDNNEDNDNIDNESKDEINNENNNVNNRTIIENKEEKEEDKDSNIIPNIHDKKEEEEEKKEIEDNLNIKESEKK